MGDSATKIAILAALGALAVGLHVLGRARAGGNAGPGTRAARAALTAALAALAVWSVGHYYHWDPDRLTRITTSSDVFHYYLAGKYARELGYTGLYECAIVADAESPAGRQLFRHVRRTRDLGDYRIISRATALAARDRCKAAFSPGRWRMFRRDVRVLGVRVRKSSRSWMLTDRGANATPVWHLWGGTLARVVPARHAKIACLADLALMIGALVWVGRAFGLRAALVGVVFTTACFSTRWPVIGSSIGRYDWMAALLAAVCALRQGRPALAGGLFSFAFLSRVYPAFFLAAVGLRGLAVLLRERRIERAHLRLVAGFAVASAVLVGAGAAVLGPARLPEAVAKLRTHTDPRSMSRQRVGLPVAAAWRGELRDADLRGGTWARAREIVARQRPYLLGGAVLLAAILAALARRLPDHAAAAMGWVLLYGSAAASYYYWVLLLVPVVVFAERIDRRLDLLGVLLLAAVSATAHAQLAAGSDRHLLTAVMSLALGACALLTLGWAWAHGRSPSARPAAAVR